jgi:MFS family permease
MPSRLLIGVSVLWVPLAFLFDGITVLVLPLRLGADATSLGLVSMVGLGIGAAFQPFAGWASDRLRGRIDRRVFIALAVAPALLGLALLAGTAGVAAAVAGYVLVQLAGSAIQAGGQTLIPEHVEHPQRGPAAGAKAAFDVGGSFVAFLVLGILLAQGQLVGAAVVTGAVLVLAVGVVLVLVPSLAWSSVDSAGALSVPPGLVPLVLARLLFLFGTYAVGRFLLLLVGQRLGMPPDRAADEAGGLLALFTFVTAAAALAFGRLADVRHRRDLMVLGSLVAAAGILVLVPDAGIVAVLAGGLLMSVGTAAFVTANWAATTDVVPAADAGRLMALANLGTGLAAAAAGMLGPLIDTSGFAPALVVAAIASGVATLPLVAMPRVPHRAEHAT